MSRVSIDQQIDIAVTTDWLHSRRCVFHYFTAIS